MKISTNCPICSSIDLRKKGAVLMPFLADRIFEWKPFEVKKEYNFNTIAPGKAYSVCNSMLCQKCHLIFLDMRFDKHEMEKLYKNYRDINYVSLRNIYEPGYKKRNEMLEKELHYIAKIEKFILENTDNEIKNLLDWGGEQGTNTPFKSYNEIEKFVYDLSGKKSLNKEIKTISSIKNRKFDLIISMHVLEHTPYPLLELKKLKNNISNNGYIYIEVPKESIVSKYRNVEKRLMNKHHWHEHINFYDVMSLKTLITKAGLKLIKLSSTNVSKGDFKLNIFQLIAKNVK